MPAASASSIAVVDPGSGFSVWGWWTSPAVQQVVDTIDFSLGVVGFALTLVGLVLGYYKLQRVQAAADAASLAAIEAKDKMAFFDATVELANAATSMNQIIDHLGKERTREAITLYDGARIALMRGLHSAPISDEKLSRSADKLNGTMLKAVSVLRGAELPLDTEFRNSAIDNATHVRDTIVLVQLHYQRGVV